MRDYWHRGRWKRNFKKRGKLILTLLRWKREGETKSIQMFLDKKCEVPSERKSMFEETREGVRFRA